MRCRMRCWDIWRCWWPIKKYVPVESIGIEWRTQEMTFDSQVPPYSVTYPISISPSDATKKDVRIESNNPSVISVDSIESGQVTFTIHSEWEARVRITSLANADISDEYGVTITAPSQQFSPNNGIFVDVDIEWTATGRKRRIKATAMWDRFTARVFALDEESEDYVLLEWVHGWDVSKTYVWAANEAYTRAMFTEEVTDKIAREIEALWDDWQIVNRFVKFTDETWSMIEQFYSEPLTPEAVEALQEVLVNNEIVTPETCPASIQAVWWNDATIEVGQTTAVITNFTTAAECENVDYSNIVAYVRASYNVPSDVATASIDFNENKVYVTWVKAWECTVVFTDWDRSWSNSVTVTEQSYTFTINVENLPEGADINWEIRDSHTGELLEEISASSFPMEFELGVFLTVDLAEWYCYMDIQTNTSYGFIEFSCDWYKLLLEPVWCDLEDEWDWAFVVATDWDSDSDASLTISFTPVE